jgi:putative spermidine/putrescine transport system substrate-binding protein
MKRIRTVTTAALTRRDVGGLFLGGGAAILAGGRPSRAQSGQTLIVASQGGDQLALWRKTVDEEFVKQTGAKVDYLVGAHPDRFVRLRASVPNPAFHVYISKADFVARAATLNLLEPMSAELVPNYASVAPAFKSPHSVAYQYTAEGILYNPKVMSAPKSWSVLWDPKYKGKVALNRFVDRMIMMASSQATKGKSLEDEEAAWALIEKLVKDQAGRLPPSSEQLGQMFQQDEVSVGTYWQARASQWKKDGLPLDFAVPEEGAIAESWHLAIPRGTPPEQRQLAAKWINIALGPTYSVESAKFWFYPGANTKVQYPPEVAANLLSKDQFQKLKLPNYAWIDKNVSRWQERYNRLLTK